MGNTVSSKHISNAPKLINNMNKINKMKKITTLILAILFSIIGYGQGDFPVSPNYGSRIASEFQSRVIDSGGTYYPNIAAHQIDQTHSYGLVPIFRMIPAAAGASVLFSQSPINGSGDFTVTRATPATRVNEYGFSENVAVNYPVIDYTYGTPVLRVTTDNIQVALPAGVISITLTDKDGAETVNGSPADPYIIPTGEWMSIVGFSEIQGLSWDSSSDTYTRLGSISAIATSTSAGDANLPIQSEMKRCLLEDNGTVNYYLDATNSDLKADGVTASDLTGTDGQVMVEIPKFWYKETLIGTVKSWYISLYNLEGYQIHPAFIKDGVEVDYRYMGAFEGGMELEGGGMCAEADIPVSTYASGDIMTSVTGTWAKTNETRAEYREMAVERGTGWRQLDYYLHSAVQLLYLVEYADFNSQTMIGMGRTELSDGTWTADSYIGMTGLSIPYGNSSCSVSNGGTAGYLTDVSSYRGVENFWGDVWKMLDGIVWDGRWTGSAAAQPVYATNNSAYFADETSTNMQHLCDASYIGTDADYIGNIEDVTGFIPSSGGGTATEEICDKYYQYSVSDRDYFRVVLVGAHSANGSVGGVFALCVRHSTGDDNTSIGARLCF